MAIRISRCSYTYDARNHGLTSRYLFLSSSDFGSRIMDVGSRLFTEQQSRFFGPYFPLSSSCSLLYHRLLSYTQWTRSW
ncbi:hypothetical protein MKW94_027969 [Papaver nudicaule]|uniref:Uncharacterized protein n=1 Tax=Papaver nudicaule TaxID=74823 RepID=A0AA41W2V6_PAPNU|nr:hypothetical protein [Papaver nudicaule]